MAKEIVYSEDGVINARVRQKTDTEANWLASDLVILKGEQAFVVNEAGEPINFKIGDGTKTFAELPYWIDYSQAAYIAYTETPVEPIAYTFVGEGTYGSIVVPAGEMGVLGWNGTAWSLDDSITLPTVDTSGLVAKTDIDEETTGNIFNKATSIDGSLVDAAGVIQNDPNYSRSGQIPIDNTNSLLYIQRNSIVGVVAAFYDEADNFIESVTNNTDFDIEVNIGANYSYGVFNVSNNPTTRQADKDAYMLSYEPITEYEPYGVLFKGIGDAKLSPEIVEKQDIVTGSVNIFDKSYFIEGGYYNRDTGDVTANAGFARSILIPIDASRIIDGKMYITRNSVNYTQGGAFYTDGVYNGGITLVNGVIVSDVIVPAGSTHVGVNVSSSQATRQADLDGYMLSYQKIPYTPYQSIITSIKGIDTGLSVDSDFVFAPFVEGMGKRIDENVAYSIQDIKLFNQTPRDIYLKQFGRYYNAGTGDRRWYFEIWDTNGLAYGGNNSTGRWDNNEDYRGTEVIDLYDQNGAIVGEASVDWSTAWPSENGGVYTDGTLTNAKLDTSVFASGTPRVSPHPLQGLRVVGLGDSIMAATINFLGLTAGEAGLVLVENNGIGGSTIAQQTGDPTGRNPMSIRFADMSDDADLVIVSGGTNDCNYSWTPFGEFTDRTPNTFLGAMHLLCENLLIKYPIKRILFMTPIKRNQDLTTPEATNAYGKTQQDYADAIIQVCGYWGIPVLDMFREGILNPFIPEIKAAYFDAVGTHPTPAGQQVMADRLTGYLRQL